MANARSLVIRAARRRRGHEAMVGYSLLVSSPFAACANEYIPLASPTLCQCFRHRQSCGLPDDVLFRHPSSAGKVWRWKHD